MTRTGVVVAARARIGRGSHPADGVEPVKAAREEGPGRIVGPVV